MLTSSDCGLHATRTFNCDEGDGVEISVVKHGLSSGAAHRYDTVEKARAVLVKFGLPPELIDRQL